MLVERWAFRAIPQAAMEARRATRQLVERTGADPAALPSIVLCVTEAVANVVTHAYRNEREPGQVELEASRPTGTLRVSVRDRGCGMAPCSPTSKRMTSSVPRGATGRIDTRVASELIRPSPSPGAGLSSRGAMPQPRSRTDTQSVPVGRLASSSTCPGSRSLR